MSTPQPLVDRIKRSDLPQAQVYVAEQPMKNQDIIGDEEYNPTELKQRNVRCQPELVGRMKEQEAYMRGETKEVTPFRETEIQSSRYTVFMLGSVLGLLLIFAFKYNDWIRSILKKLF